MPILLEKAMKIVKYHQWMILLLTIILLLVGTISTAFANTARITATTFDSAILKSYLTNITLTQPSLKKAIDPLVETEESSQDDRILQKFNQAWTKPIRKENLFGVCNQENTEVDLYCLDKLETFLEQEKYLLINNCYKPGINGKVCLDLVLGEIGVKLEDIDQWIKEIQQRQLTN
jgi:hypothetical protein